MSFKMSFSLNNIEAGGQPSKRLSLESGVYKVKITKIESKNNNSRAMFIAEVTDGEFAGSTAITSMKIPTSRTDGVIYYWRALAESCGYSDNEISQIPAWEEDHFQDKSAFLKFKKGDESKGIYSKVTWLTPDNYHVALDSFKKEPVKKSSAPNPIAPKAVEAPASDPFADINMGTTPF